MYIAKYDLGRQILHQVIVRFPLLVVSSGNRIWSANYRAFTESLLAADPIFAYRVATNGREIVRHFLITSQNRSQVEDLARELDQLNHILEGSVLRAGSSAEHDRLAAQFPPIRRNVGRQQYFAGRFGVPYDFHVLACAERLLGSAILVKSDLAIQINCRRFSPSAEDLRSARKGLADLRLARGVPEKLLAHIAAHVEDLPNKTHLIDEYLGAASDSALGSAVRTLETAFKQQHAELGLSESPVEGKASDEEIETGLESSFFDETPTRPRLWKSVAHDSIQRWFERPSEEEFASMGASNVVKASLETADLLAGISRRLDAIERKISCSATNELGELRGAIKTAETDKKSAANAARRILEGLAGTVLSELRPTEKIKEKIKEGKGPSLDRMIQRLDEIGAVPRTVLSNMRLVQTIGNKGSHPDYIVTQTDLETCILATFRIMEWYFLERQTNPGQSAVV
jgi:Domain of unknown function (DUF4145)